MLGNEAACRWQDSGKRETVANLVRVAIGRYVHDLDVAFAAQQADEVDVECTVCDEVFNTVRRVDWDDVDHVCPACEKDRAAASAEQPAAGREIRSTYGEEES